jgi:hypothetical protein
MVRTNASTETTLAVAEVTARIRAMSDADKIRLIRTSTYLSFGGARSPADLRQEAIRRAIAGTRKCPNGLSIIAFLKGAMRSIAWADRKAISRAPKLAAVPSSGDAGQNLPEAIDSRLSTEDRILQHDRLSEILAGLFSTFIIVKTTDVKEDHWEHARQDSIERIAQLNRGAARLSAEAETAKGEIAKANEGAAEANARAAEARLELEKFKAPRLLDVGRQVRIVEKAKAFAGTRFDVSALP